MPKTLNDLYARAAAEGVEVDDFRLRSGRRALSLRSASGEIAVALDTARMEGEIEEADTLAHELGHAETGAFYPVDACAAVKSRAEARARRRAVEILIPVEELLDALAHGICTRWDLAEHFGCSVETVAEMERVYGLVP